MAKTKNLPCSSCGAMMWPDYRRKGAPVCHTCRRGAVLVPFDASKCGTAKGRDEHRHKGVPICEPCRSAWNAVCSERRTKLLDAGWFPPSRPEPKVRRKSSECSKCSKRIRAIIEDPLCSTCRGDRPGRNVRVSRSTRFAIYERDGWTCQICLDPVDPLAPTNSTWDATLDHVVPRNRGGGDEPQNLRLAHRWCNSARGDLSYYADEDFRIA